MSQQILFEPPHDGHEDRNTPLAKLYRIVNHGVAGYEVQLDRSPKVFNEHPRDRPRNWAAALKYARRRFAVEKCLPYLDALRESGEVNMYGARPYLMREFNFTQDEATAVLSYWMETYSIRHAEVTP